MVSYHKRAILAYLEKSLAGAGILDRCINVGDAGSILLVTIGDTRDEKKDILTMSCCNGLYVKSRWRLLHKKCQCKLYNIKYVIMAGVLLHNICIHRNDPKSRWRLEVEHLLARKFLNTTKPRWKQKMFKE